MKRLFFCIAMAICMAACSRPYVIVQIADAQFGFTASDKAQAEGRAYDNDVTYELDCLSKAVGMVNEIQPDAVVFTGDQVHHPDNQVEWTAFKDAVSNISADVKVFHLPGNHDVFIGDRAVDMSPYEKHFGEGNFLHNDRNVTLIGLNTNYIKYDDARESEQFSWLESSLDKSNEVTLVFGHHPFFLENIEEGDGYFQIQKDKRHKYFEMFRSKGVDGVFTGHLHNNAGAEYEGVPSLTATSVAYQIGDSKPSIRVITVKDGKVSSEMIPLP